VSNVVRAAWPLIGSDEYRGNYGLREGYSKIAVGRLGDPTRGGKKLPRGKKRARCTGLDAAKTRNYGSTIIGRPSRKSRMRLEGKLYGS